MSNYVATNIKGYQTSSRETWWGSGLNKMSVISWRSVLSVEEIGVPAELIASVVIGTDCKGSCKSNYHAITTTTAPERETLCIYLFTRYTC